MSNTGDPYYNRKAVPDEFIEHVGYTGLTPVEEVANRERKYSSDKGDVRHFWNPKTKDGKLDPYYQRKKIPDQMIQGVGETGLTKEEEFLNRERKYSLHGADVRKFSNGTRRGFFPIDDPYYARKSIDKTQIIGVGDTQMTRAEEYEIRENKTSLVDFSGDPFQQLSGSGHRASIAGLAAPAAAEAARRRSSAVAPDAVLQKQQQQHHHHSGYDGDQKLSTVQSKVTTDEITPGSSTHHNGNATVGTAPLAGTTAVRDNTGHATGETGHTSFYDAATRDPDSVAPDERV